MRHGWGVCLGLVLLDGAAGTVNSAARFEPPPGKVLLLVGQSQEEIHGYMDAAKVLPAGLMGYTSIGGEGLTSPYKEGAGTQHLQKLAEEYPDTVLQIGLYMVNSCPAIVRGDMDKAIDHLAGWIQKTRRPVFLRVGYEFDGPHNHYPPADYIQAYRRIVDRFRQLGVGNVAFVWHSYASLAHRPLAEWYPGDDYVDWVGISYFNQPQRFMQPVVQFAREHDKPLMICELSPATYQTRYANAWNLWFVPLFKFIRDNNIKALSYISCNWDAWPQFADMHWGETRLEAPPEILRRWLEETAKDMYLKSSKDLFKLLGYESGKQ